MKGGRDARGPRKSGTHQPGSATDSGIAGIAIPETAQEHHPTTDAMMNMSNECDFPTNLEQAL